MQRVSKAAAILLVLALLTPSVALADEPPPPTQTPEVRIGPPGGITSEEPTTIFDLFWLWLQVLPAIG